MGIKTRDFFIIVVIAVTIIIGIFMMYYTTIQYHNLNDYNEEHYYSLKEDYIKCQVNRTIEMIEIELELATDTYQEQLELIGFDIAEHSEWIEAYNTQLIQVKELIESYILVNSYIDYALINTENGGVIETSAEINSDPLIDDYIQVKSSVQLSESTKLVLFITDESIQTLVQEQVVPVIREIRLEDNGYIWINEIVNFEGGEDYAIRKTHANLLETEGMYLSTNTEDILGNTPYQTELDGINENGEILFEYYFKKMGSDEVTRKMTYAKLYEPFSWVVATGVHLDEVMAFIEQERAEREKIYYRQMLIISLVIIIFIILFLWKIKLINDNEKYQNENKNLNEDLVKKAKKLEAVNAELEKEIQDKEIAEEKIYQINRTLDQKVNQRTRQLEYLNNILEKNLSKADEANEAKSRVLSTMSHEMRNPLNGIIGYIQLLKRDDLNDEQVEIISIINNSSKLLMSLMNDILDAEKYLRGKMTFEEKAFDLKEIIEYAIKSFEGIVLKKGLEFYKTINIDPNLQVLADSRKLGQIINNLMNNALEFTEKGSIRFFANSELLEGQVVLDIGISGRHGGIGLGLTICKEIISHYDGSIDFQSEENQGTGVRVRIYLKPIVKGIEDQSLGKEQSSIDAVVSSEHIKALVVEDNDVNQKLLKKYLSKKEIIFDMANNGVEAVEYCKNNQYDYIFMDCQMPIMDGFEATRRIRKLKKNNPKIIAITAYASKEDKKKCLDAGMDQFITKPVDLERLDELLAGSEIIAPIVKTPFSYEKQNLINKEAKLLMDEIHFDYDTCVDLIETFISQANKSFKKIDKLLIQQDYQGAVNTLHQIRGAAGAVRLDRIRKAIGNIELMAQEERYSEALKLLADLKNHKLFKQ